MSETAKPAVEPPSAARRKQLVQLAIVIAIGVAFLDGMFYVMAQRYYDAKPLIPGEVIRKTQLAFVVLTTTLAIATFSAAVWTRIFAHSVAALTACAEVAFGVLALKEGRPIVLGLSLATAGALGLWLAWLSWRGSRVGWAFLVAMTAVVATCLLFGAPKVRSHLNVGLWIALIYPGIKVVTLVALAMVRGGYHRAR